ncbi:MAG: uroporphyrinogen decarboxylase family protein [Planctomycetota bacterium]|jgi:uroporphyrinogen decarboxylase
MADSMFHRERMIAYVNGQPTDRIPFVNQWGPWDETHRRWKQQGMKDDREWYTKFNFDSGGTDVGVNFGLCPSFERKVIKEEEETLVFRDEEGVLQRARKDGTSMSEWLDYPVKDWQTWEEHKWRFDPDSPERFPEDWDRRAAELKDSDLFVVTTFYPYGFLGGPRTMMGAERCLMAMALEPDLIEDINQTQCNLWLRLLTRIFEETRVDAVHAWEDMASRQGSLISPAMFHRFLTPYYKKLMDLAKQHGVGVRAVDSDGWMHELTPLFLEAGFNAIFPYEVQAGNDVPYLLNDYPGLCALGHLDKRAMARDKEAMDAEIERVRSIVAMGRYIPHIDHSVPPDVPWENFQYFVWRWKELTGKQN